MNLNGRFRVLIEVVTHASRRFKELEDTTTISAGTWRSWWNRGAAPSAEMIEAVSFHWPHFAFWLATGRCDSLHGHIAPQNASALEIERFNKIGFGVLKR